MMAGPHSAGLWPYLPAVLLVVWVIFRALI
jgi:hypothetical protein